MKNYEPEKLECEFPGRGSKSCRPIDAGFLIQNFGPVCNFRASKNLVGPVPLSNSYSHLHPHHDIHSTLVDALGGGGAQQIFTQANDAAYFQRNWKDEAGGDLMEWMYASEMETKKKRERQATPVPTGCFALSAPHLLCTQFFHIVPSPASIPKAAGLGGPLGAVVDEMGRQKTNPHKNSNLRICLAAGSELNSIYS